MKVQPFHALYDEKSLMHQAVQQDFSKYVDHIGSEGMQTRSRLLEERQYTHLSPLVDELIQQNPRLDSSLKKRLELLRTGEAQVVITGQQTGIFGGPLYAVYKLLTCLKVARQTEQLLGRPVLPIFWLATEDHDFDEINHLIVPTHDFKTRKLSVTPPDSITRSISRLSFDKAAVKDIVRQALCTEQETRYTKELLALSDRLIETSTTYGGFFSAFLGELVDHDIIFFDADTEAVRRLEIPFFERLIQDNDEIRHALSEGIRQTKDLPDTFLNEDAAHLFVEDIGRELLYPDADFTTKQGKTYTELELLALLYTSPERFSNSVVTRPLMQDYLFPTLAYIGGPGELAYWTRLRPLFHHFDWTMPLLIPRMGAVLLQARDDKRLNQHGLRVEEALQNGIPLTAFDETGIKRELHTSSLLSDVLLEEIQRIEKQALNTTGIATKLNKQLQLTFEMIIDQKRRLHEQTNRSDRALQYQLAPDNIPQERMHSLLPWLNRYGLDLLRVLRVEYEQLEAEQLKIMI
ncbi:bacillithiol biosynthesis cysteine-adding enzyme BshC [Bacillales bacterium]|uniref:bacillithiol biosynthesis cysteine-adding enzyme BshC n=1 Tax=Exiguobacterium sp. S22-S28 TaxID=3342768 RepID=UPI0011C8EC59